MNDLDNEYVAKTLGNLIERLDESDKLNRQLIEQHRVQAEHLRKLRREFRVFATIIRIIKAANTMTHAAICISKVVVRVILSLVVGISLLITVVNGAPPKWIDGFIQWLKFASQVVK